MENDTPPYMNAYGNIGRALNKIKSAQTPPRFTQDFLTTKLDLSGGGARPLIPFLKRTGFLGSDGVPTERYKRFRNPGQSGRAAREALREGYKSLYEVNEYIHDASDKDLLGVVVQVTGLEPNSATSKAIVASFKALKEFATFDDGGEAEDDSDEEDTANDSSSDERDEQKHVTLKKGLGLSYTINLNLPPTSDIKVFDAIFRSLRENLLQ
jgi:hypothetical protein